MGVTGEYSDRGEWLVAATSDEERAKSYVQALTDHYNAYVQASGGFSEARETRYIKNGESYVDLFFEHMKILDENFQVDYTGTDYWYSPVKMLETIN